MERVLRFFSAIGEFFARFFGGIAGFFRQQVTVMLVPHSERNIFNFRISAFSMVVVIFLLVYSSILFSRGYRKSNDRAGKEQDSSRQAGDRLPGHLRSAFI